VELLKEIVPCVTRVPSHAAEICLRPVEVRHESDTWGQRGSAFGTTRHALAKHMRLAEGHRTRSGIAATDNRTATCYYCQGYSDAVTWPKPGWINLCEPGKENTRMLRALP
jgi:hypothetical protein